MPMIVIRMHLMTSTIQKIILRATPGMGRKQHKGVLFSAPILRAFLLRIGAVPARQSFFCVFVCAHERVRACMCAHVRVRACARMCVCGVEWCVCVCAHAHMSVCVVCVSECVCVCA